MYWPWEALSVFGVSSVFDCRGWVLGHDVLKWRLVCFGFVGGECLWNVLLYFCVVAELSVCMQQLWYVLCMHLYVFKYGFVYVCVTDRLELLAKLLVKVGGLLQSGLQGGDLLLFNLQS